MVSVGAIAVRGNPSVGLNAATLSKLQELLKGVRRADKDVKMRLAALQWSRALFGWEPFVIDTIFMLAGQFKSIIGVVFVTLL